jgi:diguanylate cyclase (GGDEF)-like protein
MELDLRTIAVLSTVLAALVFVALAAVARDYPPADQPELRYWSVGVGLLALGWSLFASRGSVHDGVSVVLANLLLYLAFLFLLFALRAFLRLPVFRWRDLPGPFLQLAVSSVFLWVIPHLTARIVLGALLVAVVLGEAARTLWVHAPRPQPMAYHVVGVSLVVMAGILVLRAFVQAVLAPVDDAMRTSFMQVTVYAMANMAPLIATLGFLLMINDRALRELHRLAICDPLTGLVNRRELERRAERLLVDRDARLAVVAIDADHFKQINDSHGHEAGDRVLVALASRLTAAARPGDVVGRLGGEEFVMLLPQAEAGEAFERAEALRAAVAGPPLRLRGDALAVTVSIGVALRGAETTLAELLRRADHAMYAAKAAGRNRVIVAD